MLSARHCSDVPRELNGTLDKVVFGSDMLRAGAPARTVERFVSTAEYGIETAGRTALRGVKSTGLSVIVGQADLALQDTFENTLRPGLVQCPATPWPVRRTVNALVDHAWDRTHEKLVHTLGVVLAEKFAPGSSAAPGREGLVTHQVALWQSTHLGSVDPSACCALLISRAAHS